MPPPKKPIPKELVEMSADYKAGKLTPDQLEKKYGYRADVMKKIVGFVDGDESQANDPIIKRLFGGSSSKAPTAADIGESIEKWQAMDPRKKFGTRVEKEALAMGERGENYQMSASVPEHMKSLTCIGGVCLVQQRAGNKFKKGSGTKANKAYEKEGITDVTEYNPTFWDNADKYGYDVQELDDLSTVRKGDIVGKYGKAYDGTARMMHSNIALQDGSGQGPAPVSEGKQLTSYNSYSATNSGKAIIPAFYKAESGSETGGAPVKWKVARIKASRAAEIEGPEFQKQWGQVEKRYMETAVPVIKKSPMAMKNFLDYSTALKTKDKAKAAQARAAIEKAYGNDPALLKQLFDGQ